MHGQGRFRKIPPCTPNSYRGHAAPARARIRQLFGLVEDLNTLPLRAPRQTAVAPVRSYGVPSLENGNEIRIGLQLAQEELVQLLGASRQRVNQSSRPPWNARMRSASKPAAGGADREALMRIAESSQ